MLTQYTSPRRVEQCDPCTVIDERPGLKDQLGHYTGFRCKNWDFGLHRLDDDTYVPCIATLTRLGLEHRQGAPCFGSDLDHLLVFLPHVDAATAPEASSL